MQFDGKISFVSSTQLRRKGLLLLLGIGLVVWPVVKANLANTHRPRIAEQRVERSLRLCACIEDGCPIWMRPDPEVDVVQQAIGVVSCRLNTPRYKLVNQVMSFLTARIKP